MKSDAIKNLEHEINRAVAAIARLKNDTNNLEKENESLRRQIEDHRARAEEYKKALSTAAENPRLAHPDIDTPAVKARLEKLVVKLAALEDSWN
jgi:regulator of replication initiation timing